MYVLVASWDNKNLQRVFRSVDIEGAKAAVLPCLLLVLTEEHEMEDGLTCTTELTVKAFCQTVLNQLLIWESTRSSEAGQNSLLMPCSGLSI